MIGFICAIISGISMTLQGVFNTRLSEKIGSWETNTIVQASGLALTLIILLFFRKGDFRAVKEVNKLYWWQRVLICLGLTVLIFGVISIIRKTKKLF